MAVDKLVDSTQLDADLTSVANAIRTKGGTSAQMAFPNGFVSAVQAIPSGGSGIPQAEFDKFMAGEECDIDYGSITYLVSGAFSSRNLGNCNFASLASTQIGPIFGSATMPISVFPTLTHSSMLLRNCATAITVDFGAELGNISARSFEACSNLTNIILRKSDAVPVLQGAAFTGTKFASGGAGGTIYIPKALYDHLGDGTALDYKAATNWSTVDGYGTITWAQIEGSQYENYYADGTPIT